MYHGRNMHIDKPVRRQAQIKMHVKHRISSGSQLYKNMPITKLKHNDLSSQKTECSWARHVTAENIIGRGLHTRTAWNPDDGNWSSF